MANFAPRFLALLLCCATAQAEAPALAEARQALSESLPGIAIQKLRRLLSQPAAPDRPAATLLLGQALAASGAYEEAAQIIQAQVAAKDSASVYLQAEILSALGRWGEARTLFHSVAGQPGAPAAATVGEAEALHALGRTEEAALLLEAALHAGHDDQYVRLRWAVLLCELHQLKEAQAALKNVHPATPEAARWKSYAEARVLLMQEQPAPALQLFQGLLENHEHLPESLLVAATFGATDAKIALNGTQDADDVLETFIWRHPGSTWLESVFRRLDQIYAQEENPSEAELRKWANKSQARRAALAWFYVGRMQLRGRKLEKAAVSLEYFLRTYPRHPLAADAFLMQAELFSLHGRFPEAAHALESALRLTQDPALRASIELRTGLAHFQQSEFLLSATLFEEAARHSAALRPVATFDAALAWLHLRNLEKFGAQRRAFIQLQPSSPLRGELSLEEGLEGARAGDPGAAAALKGFVRDYPHSPRQAEARLAIAELGLLAGAAPIEPEYQQVSNPVPPPPEIAAQSAYLAIFLADSQQPRDDAATIALARRFLAERPTAEQIPEVRMKLGQIYFRREDYANAETQFATLAEGSPGPYTEGALFLAGECAMKLINPGAVDRALGFFDRVVKLEGPMRLYARQEQAIVQSRLEHEDQALALYEIILGSPEVDPELWQAALCGKGDNLVALGRRALPDAARMDEAIAVFDQLAKAEGIAAVWRNQALYKKARALELLGRGEEALAAYYDVLNPPAAGEREFFWFYKAGFDAARTYERQENWKSAIGIYQKMVKAEGPRTAEAQSRLRQLRLEHFIWE